MKWLNDFFLGADGDKSSKRLLIFCFVVFAIMYLFVNLFWGFTLKQTLEDYLFGGIFYFFAGIALDRWRKNTAGTNSAAGGGDRPKDPPPNP